MPVKQSDKRKHFINFLKQQAIHCLQRRNDHDQNKFSKSFHF
jgi:hypothetical protein